MTLNDKERWLSSKDDRWQWTLEKLQAARDQPPLGTNRDERTGWAAAQLDAYETAVEAMYEAQMRADTRIGSTAPNLTSPLPELFSSMTAARLKYQAAEKGVSEALEVLRACVLSLLAVSRARQALHDAFQQYHEVLARYSGAARVQSRQGKQLKADATGSDA